MSYTGLGDIKRTTIKAPKVEGDEGVQEEVEFVSRVLEKRLTLGYNSNLGELAAFIAYAQAFPMGFLALVDTYDTLNSGYVTGI
jgi:nicotinate phosphoribosyltransferase